MTTLIAVAHGTRSATGQAQIRALVARVAHRRPDLTVRLCYADVQSPRVGEAIRDVQPPRAGEAIRDVQPPRAGEAIGDVRPPRAGQILGGFTGDDCVVVPLLLSAGYHVRVDIAEAVAGTAAVVAEPLGPDDVLLDSLTRHLPPADAVVLAAAGSRDPVWRAGVEQMAEAIGGHVAYASGGEPKVADVVSRLRRSGASRVAIAAYLLADGHFYRTLHRAGADAVTPPLSLDPAVAGLILRRLEAGRFLTSGTVRL